MKKHVKRIFLAACFIAGLALIFTGCAYPNPKLAGQDTSYAVTSNGGIAVQYGDYVYFVNGNESQFDETKENRWGETVKGGIYRAKIENGKTVTEKDSDNVEYKTYKREAGGQYLDIKKAEVTNFNEDEEKIKMIDSSSVERVVPKYVKTSGDAYAGFFIYDGWIYYNSPNVRKDKAGEVNYELSEFYRTKVDGRGTQLLYRSEEAVTDYNFYHYEGKVYLVFAEGENLVSIPIGKRAGRVSKLADGITEVYFPRRETYYKSINEDTAADYVYYTRVFNKSDNSLQGNVLECRRPDLNKETGIHIFDNNNTYGIAGVDGNTLFYYETKATAGSKKVLWAQPRFDLWAKAALNSLLPENKQKAVSEAPLKTEVILNVIDEMTQLRPFNNGTDFSAITVDKTNIVLHTRGTLEQRICVTSSEPAICKIADGTLYFSDGVLFSVFAAGNRWADQLTQSAFTAVDMAADMFWFFGTSLNQRNFDIELRLSEGEEIIYANYMFVKQMPGAKDTVNRKDSGEFFIGEVGPGELPEEEE